MPPLPTPARATLRRTLGAALIALAPLASIARPAAAQDPGELPRPHQDWRTIESRHFTFHYPSRMREWTLATAPKMDAIHGAVRALVGWAPTRRVHIVVDDPAAEANGSAWPIVRAPVIYLWPNPPEPTSAIGNNRSWGEILGVHEFAHIAHMARPSRQRLRWLRTPIGALGVGPITEKAPRWAFEGYATFVEGRLTGHGRPRGVWRPAILRQFAREGRLPTYAGLNASGGFQEGSLAYLAGSAYLEWLAERRGDSSLVHVWRRLTAVTERSFDDAFTGVYGAPPAVLYGRFVAELTERAMEAEERIAGADSSAAGETVQRYQWYTGEPALSPDGKFIALTVGDRITPARVVVLPTAPDTVTEREREARRKRLARDPEDVLPIEILPRPRKPAATLWPTRGSSFARPRWFRDNERVLLVHRDSRPDGARRPDLWIWNRRTKALRRVTHGSGVRSADPSPDGTRAAGVRCLDGNCDVVLVDLGSGRVRTLAKGTPTRSWYRPRWSPDGATLATAVQRDGIWRVALLDAATGAERAPFAQRDSVNRYDASFTPDGRAIVFVSEASGIPNVERVDLASGAVTPVTRVLGAATAPEVEPSGRGIIFLSLSARGQDLRRIVPESTTVSTVARIDTALAPAVATGIVRADTFATGALSPERGYGTGPRRHLLLPWGLGGVEGSVAGLALAGTDPVGRLTWTLAGGWGLDYDADARGARRVANRLLASEGMWRGGSLRAEWRGLRPVIEGEGWWTEQRPGEQAIGAPDLVRGLALDQLDHRQYGARIGARLDRQLGWREHTYRAGLVASRLDDLAGANEAQDRRLAYAALGGTYQFQRRLSYVGMRWNATGSAGTTADADWQRVLVGAGVFAGGREGGLRLDATWGRAYDAPRFEQFAVGGVATPFFDQAVMSQRLAMPAMPVGLLSGSRVATWRAALTGGAFSPFFMGAVAGDRLPELSQLYTDSYRLAGIESTLRVPNIPFVRTPGADITAGLAYTLDEPLDERWRGWFGITYRP